ncbi:MAG: hypothetical protein AAFQ22_11270 [Pseudomonadota bacterium]
MKKLQIIFSLGPLWFGLGFLAPLLDRSAAALGVEAIFGIDALYAALLIGGGWGALAMRRRRWV